MSYVNLLVHTELFAHHDSYANRNKLTKRFIDDGVVQCNLYGIGDVWRDGKLADMTEEFAADMLWMMDAPSVPATASRLDGPCDCCAKNSNCCLRDGHNGDCDTSMADNFTHMMKHLL